MELDQIRSSVESLWAEISSPRFVKMPKHFQDALRDLYNSQEHLLRSETDYQKGLPMIYGG